MLTKSPLPSVHASVAGQARARRWIWAYLITATAVGAAALTACVSLAGLSGGDAGCGASCADGGKLLLPTDAGSDTSSRHDAGHTPDAQGHPATDAPDAARDGGLDGRVESDAPACVPVDTSDASLPSTCPPPSPTGDGGDGGACAPGAVSASGVQWIPSPPPQHVCTTDQIAGLFTEGVTIPANCRACLVSYVGTGATTYGTIVEYPQITTSQYGFANFGGCIAVMEPCNLACAKAVQAAALCENEACLNSCTLGADDNAGFFGCLPDAPSSCECAAYSAVAQTCVDEIEARGSPAIACFPTTTGGGGQAAYVADVEAIGAVLCGGAPDEQ